MLTRTTTDILDALMDPANGAMWREFDERYRPVVIAFARRRGLNEEDSADVAQMTLSQFAGDYQAGRYDRTRGRLGAWIIGIARHRVADVWKNIQRRRRERGEVELGALADGHSAEDDWEAARQKVILERALLRLRSDTRMDEKTLRAFDLSAMRGMPVEEVANECGMHIGAVYVAKNRAIAKLREFVAEVTREFDD